MTERRNPGTSAPATSTTPIAANRSNGRPWPADIPGDLYCERCGMVIICPHTPAVPYPPNCITAGDRSALEVEEWLTGKPATPRPPQRTEFFDWADFLGADGGDA